MLTVVIPMAGKGQRFIDGWIAVSPLWLRNGTGYVNMLHSDCIVMDAVNCDSKNWETIKYLGRKFNCPENPKKWLSEWYGKDWKTPNSSKWQDNKNRKSWEQI